jgi:tRNA(adenine34) deaminase
VTGWVDVADERRMRRALELARGAIDHGDVPIGCVVVREDQELASAGNARERDADPTAHAEILALREASRVLGSWRLDGCTLYVTLEPCAMCAGAIVLARVDRVVIGAPDPKAGFAGSLGNLLQDPRLNHRPELVMGVLEEECSEVLRGFFRIRRGPGSGADR